MPWTSRRRAAWHPSRCLGILVPSRVSWPLGRGSTKGPSALGPNFSQWFTYPGKCFWTPMMITKPTPVSWTLSEYSCYLLGPKFSHPLRCSFLNGRCFKKSWPWALVSQRCSLTCSDPDTHGAAVPREWWPRRCPGLVPSTLACSSLVRDGSEPSMTLWFTYQRGISPWEPVRRQIWRSLQTWIFLISLLIFGCPGSLLLHAGFLMLQRAGATLGCRTGTSHCGGFFSFGARVLGAWTSIGAAFGLSSCSSQA